MLVQIVLKGKRETQIQCKLESRRLTQFQFALVKNEDIDTVYTRIKRVDIGPDTKGPKINHKHRPGLHQNKKRKYRPRFKYVAIGPIYFRVRKIDLGPIYIRIRKNVGKGPVFTSQKRRHRPRLRQNKKKLR